MRALALIAAIALLPCPTHASLEIRLVARNADAPPSRATVTLTSAADRSQRHIVNVPGRIELPAGSVWEVELASDGWWADGAVITVNDPIATLDVWRTTRVTGRVTREGALPDRIQLAIRSDVTFPCPVDDDGRFACALPAATHDLVLRANDATPHYRWDVDLAHTPDLGTFALKRGASVFAMLARPVEEPARARLLRMDGREAVAEAMVNKRGAVQLAPVVPGTYILDVQAKGFAPARAFPVVVREAHETILRKPIELQKPMTIDVAITPPRDPAGTPWYVALARANDSGYDPAPARIAADDRGHVRAHDQAAGRFRIEVTDAQNNRVALRFDEIDEHSADVAIELPLIEIAGTVTVGDDPLAATLWFGGRHNDEHVKLVSDAGGIFKGWLPRGGRWNVDVESGDIRGVVNVEAARDVAIRLPGTSISGSVIDEAGKPVPNASVQLAVSGRAVDTVADAEGRFTMRAVPQGVGTLTARHLRDTSAELRVAIDEGRELSGLVLRLDRNRIVRGRVTSRGTPLVNARITIYPADTGTSRQRGMVSKPDGTFEIALAANVSRALVSVAATARSLQMFDVIVSDAPLELDVAPLGGTLVLHLPRERQYVAVKQNGIDFPPNDLDTWIRSHRLPLASVEELQAPHLAPGAYRVCVTHERCAGGTLAAGGTLTLDLR